MGFNGMGANLDASLIASIACFVISSLIVVIMLGHVFNKKRKQKNMQNLTRLQDDKMIEFLLSLDTMEFLDRLKEFLEAYAQGQLRMTQPVLTMIVRVRSEKLRNEYRQTRFALKNQPKVLAGVISETAVFITERIVNAKLGRKRLRKMLPHFKKVVAQLEDYSTNPIEFFTGNNSPYKRISVLLTVVLKSAGAKKALRVDAALMLNKLEKSWQDFRKLKARYREVGKNVRRWKAFGTENNWLIKKILNENDYSYKGWPRY